jgi:lipid II:glycine glycyltransferase (peptidoglycan interpeptide bridge formation enzyme)
MQSFNAGFTNWLPFKWKGFTQTTRYTYVIDGLGDLERVFGDFTTSARGWVRKATKQVETKTGASVEDFHKLSEKTWHRQGRDVPYTLSFLQRLDETLAKHESREIFIAVDAEGRQHSGLYLTWDAKTAYVQLVGEDPELRGGAGRLLVWEAIQYTAEKLGLDRFDFLGSMVEDIEEARRSFGAHQVQHFTIRCDRRTVARRLMQNLVGRLRPGLTMPRSS